MAQFDVHRNSGARSAAARPFLVDIQSNRFTGIAFRLVAVLVRHAVLRDAVDAEQLSPRFVIAGQTVFLNPFEITPVPVERLGPPVASFAEDEDARRRIQKALDEVLSQY